MPLDNAEFIAELDILSPAGTDPLNQGDDQIRTTKKAVQQSLPLLDAAVNISSAQMNQMAIKNAANDFTQFNTFTGGATFVAASFGVDWTFSGNVAFTNFRPTVGGVAVATLGANTFIDDQTLDSGVNNRIKFSFGGVQAWEILHVGASAQLELRRFVSGVLIDAPMQVNNAFGEFTFLADASFNRTVLLGDGVSTAPAFRFINETSMGMFRLGQGGLGFAVGGASRLEVRATDIRLNQVALHADGNQASPGVSFLNQTDVGFFATPTAVTAVAGNTQLWAMSTNGMFSGLTYQNHVDGDLGGTVPGWTFNNDSDTGIGRAAANSLNIIAGGEVAINPDFATKAVWLGAGYALRGDPSRLETAPAFSFTNDTDTGFYRVQANISGIAGAGQSIMTFGTGGVGIVAGVPFFPSLPTSPGIGGSLWNDAGTVKVA